MLLLGVLQAQAAGGAAVDSDFDLLETQVLASAEASVTFSSLSTYAADYQHLQIRMTAKVTATTFDNGFLTLSYNGDTTDANYRNHQLYGTGSSVISGTEGNSRYIGNVPSSRGDVANRFGGVVIDVLDAFSTNKNKTARIFIGYNGVDGSLVFLNSLFRANTESTTSLTIAGNSDLATGSRFSLYGIKAGS